MWKYSLWTAFAFFVFLGFLQADEFTATLVKVADGKVTFVRGAGKKKKEVQGGLKNPIFEKLDKETLEALVRTNKENDKILELRLFQSTKKKKS